MAGSISVFVGPSLLPEDRHREGFEWHAPARAGDLLALLPDPPARLCLIDGLFDRCAAPWHKEILLLAAAGTQIFGAASMGALRAAELDCHGMIGIGRIYDAYRRGLLTGDDEVALIHATERLRWAALTVPMVEVRATLAAACRAGVLEVPHGRRIREMLHGIHFEERDWPAMAQLCSSEGLLDIETFARLRSLYVPLKRMDALACLEAALLGAPTSGASPPPLTYFMRRLASETGVEAALDPTLHAARRTAAHPKHPRTDGGA